MIEVPANPITASDRAAIALSRLYRRPVILGYDVPWIESRSLHLRTACGWSPRALRASGGRFVVLVFDRPTLNRAAAGIAPPDPGSRPPWRRRITKPAERLDRRLRSAWGPPHLSDDRAELWDLARLPAPAAPHAKRRAPVT